MPGVPRIMDPQMLFRSLEGFMQIDFARAASLLCKGAISSLPRNSCLSRLTRSITRLIRRSLRTQWIRVA